MKAILLALFVALSPSDAIGATVEQVLDYYHTTEFLGQGLGQLEDALKRRRKEITVPDDVAAQIVATARKIYRASNLMDVFKAAYAKAISLGQRQALATWQVGVKGLLLRRGINAYYTKSNPMPPPETTSNRRNAINTYVLAHELDDLYASWMLGADLAVWLALEAFQPPKNRETIKFIREKIKLRRTGYNEFVRSKAFDDAVQILKKLKNDEIDEISKFASSPPGQVSTRAYRRALELTLERAGETLAKQVAVQGG